MLSRTCFAVLLAGAFASTNANSAVTFGRSPTASNLAGWSTIPNGNGNPNSFIAIPPNIGFWCPTNIKPIAAANTLDGGTLLLDVSGRIYGAGPIVATNGLPGISAPTPGAFLPIISDVIQLEDSGKGNGGRVVALRADGTVYRWGTGLPLGTIPSLPAPAKGTKQVVSSSSGTVMLSGAGQLHIDPPNSLLSWQNNMPLPLIKDVAVGLNHVIALAANGDVYAWGDNSTLQVDPNAPAKGPSAPNPIYKVSGLKGKARRVLADQVTSYAILCDGTVQFWGRNGPNIETMKTNSGFLSDIKDGWCGAETVYLLRADGVVFAFGLIDRFSGGAGPVGSNSTYAEPVSMSGMTGTPLQSGIIAGGGANPTVLIQGRAKANFCGGGQNLATVTMTPKMPSATFLPAPFGMWKFKQNVTGIGIDVHGRVNNVGNFNSFSVFAPTSPAIEADNASKQYMYLSANGKLFITGQDTAGLTSNTFSTNVNNALVPTPNNLLVLDFALNESECWVICEDGTLWHKGQNKNNASGTGISGPITTPQWRQVQWGGTVIQPMTDVIDVVCNLGVGMALMANGEVYVWGSTGVSNNAGQLGVTGSIPTTLLLAGRQMPILQSGVPQTVKQIAIGSSTAVALSTNGTAFGWGTNLFGQLSPNHNVNAVVGMTAPIGGAAALNNVKSVSGGLEAIYLLRANGQILSAGTTAGMPLMSRIGRVGPSFPYSFMHTSVVTQPVLASQISAGYLSRAGCAIVP